MWDRTLNAAEEVAARGGHRGKNMFIMWLARNNQEQEPHVLSRLRTTTRYSKLQMFNGSGLGTTVTSGFSLLSLPLRHSDNKKHMRPTLYRHPIYIYRSRVSRHRPI
jgi:hypothetical protein